MAGWRQIRWEGSPSVFDDPGVLSRLARGTLSRATVDALTRYDRVRVPLSTVRILGPGDAGGFSRTYRFVRATQSNPSGPFQEMTEADVELLMGNRWDRWEFVDVTDAPIKARRPMQGRDWQRLLEDFALVEATTERWRGSPFDKDVVTRQLVRAYR